MRRLFLLITIVVIAVSAQAQITIPATNVSFDFPSKGWKFLQTTNVDKDVTVYLYSYKAQNIVDAEGDTIIPFMRIYVRKNYPETVYDLVFSRYMTQPFQTLSEFDVETPFHGIGYVGAYNDQRDGKDYQFRMIYFKDKNTVVEVRLETTIDTFEQMDEEFQSILATMQAEGK